MLQALIITASLLTNSSVIPCDLRESVKMATTKEIERFFAFAKEITLDAAKIIKTAINEKKEVESKIASWDLVTEYDKKIEEILIGKLSQEFPNHKFIAEETSSIDGNIPELTDDPTWLIDPIDGTVNFVHAFPQSCLSIALAIGKQLEIGIVCNPSYDEMYTAIRGRGAYLNDVPIHSSKITDLKDSLMMLEPGFIRSKTPNRDLYLARLEVLIDETQGIRNVGSAALTLAYIASGKIDMYHIDGLKPWDVAAGALLVAEAGGTIISTKGGAYDFMAPKTIAAATEELARKTSKLIVETDLKTQRKRLKKL